MKENVFAVNKAYKKTDCYQILSRSQNQFCFPSELFLRLSCEKKFWVFLDRNQLIKESKIYTEQ